MNNFEAIHSETHQVFIGEVLGELQSFLQENYKQSLIVVLVDENTSQHCLPLLEEKVLSSFSEVEIIEIEPGEQYKQIETCFQLWNSLVDVHADRNSVLLNLGGGVIGDMGGFVASTFLRGIDFIQIPTSLLAMVDASVGGKLGVDLGALKNHVGLFQHPKAVFVNPVFLHTLPPEQLRSGLAEMIKHGLIANPDHYVDLQSIIETKGELETSHIVESISIKNQIVQQDFKEAGERKKLNFGHTVGHAIESWFLEQEKPILHGEAVAAGMVIEGLLSFDKGWSQNNQKSLENMILAVFGKIDITTEQIEPLIAYMRHDKKNQNQNINFTLLKAMGSAQVNCHVDESQIRKSLKYYIEL